MTTEKITLDYFFGTGSKSAAATLILSLSKSSVPELEILKKKLKISEEEGKAELISLRACLYRALVQALNKNYQLHGNVSTFVEALDKAKRVNIIDNAEYRRGKRINAAVNHAKYKNRDDCIEKLSNLTINDNLSSSHQFTSTPTIKQQEEHSSYFSNQSIADRTCLLVTAAYSGNLECLCQVEKELGGLADQYWLQVDLNELEKKLQMPTDLSKQDGELVCYETLFDWYQQFSTAPWRYLYDELMLIAYDCSAWLIQDWSARKIKNSILELDSNLEQQRYVAISSLIQKLPVTSAIDVNIALKKENELYAPSLFFHELIIDYIRDYLGKFYAYIAACVQHAADETKQRWDYNHILTDSIRVWNKLIDRIANEKMSNNKTDEIAINKFTEQFLADISKLNDFEIHLQVIVSSFEPNEIIIHENLLECARVNLRDKYLRYLSEKKREYDASDYEEIRRLLLVPSWLLAAEKKMKENHAALFALKQIEESIAQLIPVLTMQPIRCQHIESFRKNLQAHPRLEWLLKQVLAGQRITKGLLFINMSRTSESVNRYYSNSMGHFTVSTKKTISNYNYYLILIMAAYSGDLATLLCVNDFLRENTKLDGWQHLNLELIEKRIEYCKPECLAEGALYSDLIKWYQRHANSPWRLDYDTYCMQGYDCWSASDWLTRASHLKQLSLPDEQIATTQPKLLSCNNACYLVAPSFAEHKEIVIAIGEKYDFFLAQLKIMQQQNINHIANSGRVVTKFDCLGDDALCKTMG